MSSTVQTCLRGVADASITWKSPASVSGSKGGDRDGAGAARRRSLRLYVGEGEPPLRAALVKMYKETYNIEVSPAKFT